MIARWYTQKMKVTMHELTKIDMRLLSPKEYLKFIRKLLPASTKIWFLSASNSPDATNVLPISQRI